MNILEARTHYHAEIFRLLLDSLARPGKLNYLPAPTSMELPDGKVNQFAVAALLSLLDGATDFAVVDGSQTLPENAPLVSWLKIYSNSQSMSLEQCDFALLLEGSSAEILSQLKSGTALEPELSATAFICVEKLSTNPASGLRLELTGPGIETVAQVSVLGISLEMLEAISANRRNYPLGIDVYLIDQAGACLGLPRTTRLAVKE